VPNMPIAAIRLDAAIIVIVLTVTVVIMALPSLFRCFYSYLNTIIYDTICQVH
jgi:hypothetical protein